MQRNEQHISASLSASLQLPRLSEFSSSSQRPIAEDLNSIKSEREKTALHILNFNQGLVRPPSSWTESIRSWFKVGLDSIEPWSMGRVSGRETLRGAIAEWRQPVWGTTLGPANVLITLGANSAWNLTMRAITNPGDFIALTKPYFFNHFGSINRNARQCAFIDLDFGNELESLRRNYLSILELSDVRAVLFSNPNNPTGTHFPRKALNLMEESCRKLGKWLVLDESYGALKQSDAAFLKSGVGLNTYSTITIGSLTKSLALGDIRLGYVIAHEAVIDALVGFADDDYICASQIMQYVAERAIDNRQLVQADITQDLNAKRIVLEAAIRNSPLLELSPGRSAVFAWIRLPEGVSDTLLVQVLASEKGLLLTPGSYYGVPGCIRISYGMCNNYLELELAIKYISDYLK